MPLLDHFRPPIYPSRGWESFHSRWGSAIADDLNARLPERFIAEAPYHLGPTAAADVAEYELQGDGSANTDGGVATLTYAPPATRLRMPLPFPPEFPVRVYDLDRTRMVVAVVELASPSNKDRESSRRLFAAKCGGYLGFGIGLVLVDVVTSRRFNLHNQLVRDAGCADELLLPDDVSTYAIAYRPAATRDGEGYADIWPYTLAIGEPLPTVPLALRGYGCIPIDLEATYTEACVASRLP